MSKGPGRIERAIRELFDTHPDLAFVTDELAEHCYPDARPIERKHQVAVLRAARNVIEDDPDWRVWRIMGMGGGYAFVNQANEQSYALGHMIAGPLPDIIYRSEKRQRRRPGQWVRIRRSGGHRRKLLVDWEREFVADRAQLLDVHGEYATGGGRDGLTRGNFTKGTWAEKVADHIGWRDGGPEVRAALQAKHEAALAYGKMLADRVMGRAPPDDKRYQAGDVVGNETLIALADRLRALSVQNDPDALRAGLANIACALDQLGGREAPILDEAAD